jgi:DNA-binding transcriptional ArsR family regulator
MPPPEDQPILDRLIHEPGRLAILTVLSSVRDADFLFLQRATGLTKGNLSSHLAKLEDAGLVEIEKRFIRKKPNTNVALTSLGSERISTHWEQLERLKAYGNTTSFAPGPERSRSHAAGASSSATRS